MGLPVAESLIRCSVCGQLRQPYLRTGRCQGCYRGTGPPVVPADEVSEARREIERELRAELLEDLELAVVRDRAAEVVEQGRTGPCTR